MKPSQKFAKWTLLTLGTCGAVLLVIAQVTLSASKGSPAPEGGVKWKPADSVPSPQITIPSVAPDDKANTTIERGATVWLVIQGSYRVRESAERALKAFNAKLDGESSGFVSDSSDWEGLSPGFWICICTALDNEKDANEFRDRSQRDYKEKVSVRKVKLTYGSHLNVATNTPPSSEPTTSSSPSLDLSPPPPTYHPAPTVPNIPYTSSIDASEVVSAASDVVDETAALKRAVDDFSDGYSNWRDVAEDVMQKQRVLFSSVDDLTSNLDDLGSERRKFNSAQRDAYDSMVDAHNEFVEAYEKFAREMRAFGDGYSDWKDVIDDVETAMRRLTWAADDVESAGSEVDSAFP